MDPMTDHGADIRRLRAELRRLEKENDDLRARLAVTDQEIEQLREEVIALRAPQRTAAPAHG